MTERANDSVNPGGTGTWTVVDLEDSYLKLLRGLMVGAEGNPAQLGVVRRIAAWIQSQEVLRFIAAEPAWISDWEIKEALLRNPATPADVRSVPERQIAIFDLLRELDQPGLSEGESQEIREDARSLIGSLEEADRQAVKTRAYELSKSRAEAPPADSKEDDTGALPEPVIEDIDKAELSELFSEDLWEEVFDKTSRGAPAAEAEAPAAEPDPAPPAGEPAPAPAAAADSADGEVEGTPRDESVQAARREESPETSEAPATAPTTEAEAPPPEEPLGEDGEATSLPPSGDPVLDAEVQVARTSTDDDLLRRLAQSRREAIHMALLENPAVREGLILPLARRAGSRLAGELYRRRRWFNRPAIRQALLENPNAPALAQLATVRSLTDVGLLLRLLASAKVRHLEVKSKARERIRTVFRTFSVGEKVAMVRRHGRRLLSHLWTDFFRDEALVLRCLQERQLDEGTVLEIARSRVAPRRALERIGTTPAWTANYSIVLALVLNPKTPRQIAQRLLGKLTPADRKRVKGSLSVAESVRRMA